MGPGLVCIGVLLVGGIMSLWKRWRTRREGEVDRLTGEATSLFSKGLLEDARGRAVLAVEKADAAHASTAARAHYSLGRVLGRVGDNHGAREHLSRAVVLATDPHLCALAGANLSLVLRRLDQRAEALERANSAVRIHEGFKSYPEPFMRAGAGWAKVALSLAQTDTGQDGLQAAREAVPIFERTGIPDGVAHAYYAMAYAAHARRDDAAATYAWEAYRRFEALHATIPSLYRERLLDSQKLLEETSR